MESFLETVKMLLENLDEYEKLTERFSEISLLAHANENDLEDDELTFVIDDIEDIIQEREEVREHAEALHVEMSEKIKSFKTESEDDFLFIKSAFENPESCLRDVSDLHKEVFKIIANLLLVQRRIVDKDQKILEKLKEKQEQIKGGLKNLKSSKKKLDFLNLTTSGVQEDKSFNI